MEQLNSESYMFISILPWSPSTSIQFVSPSDISHIKEVKMYSCMFQECQVICVKVTTAYEVKHLYSEGIFLVSIIILYFVAGDFPLGNDTKHFSKFRFSN